GVTEDVLRYSDEIGAWAGYGTVQVQAQVSGKIVARHFQDGADVKKGDLLFTIDPAPFQAALDQAKAQAALDQVPLKRQADLRSRNVIAPQDYDTAVANAQKSQAGAEPAQGNYDDGSIKPPIKGHGGAGRLGDGESARGHTKSRPRFVAVRVCARSFHSRYDQGCAARSFASRSDQSKWAVRVRNKARQHC